MSETIDRGIFNTQKTDYETQPLILGQPGGLFDTINQPYPTIWRSYKAVKGGDWDEKEFPTADCKLEFIQRPKAISDIMINSLAYQWEADTVASTSIAHIVSLYDPCPALWAAWLRISDQEVLHAAQYSEIVRQSFDDPRKVLEDIIARNEQHYRIETVGRAMAHAREMGLKYQLGMIPNNQELYNAFWMFVFALLTLERLSFMSSFANTFALGKEEMFIPIVKAVQRICQDEYELHVEMDRLFFVEALKTERGRTAFRMCKPAMERLLNETLQTEFNWSDGPGNPNGHLKYLTLQSLKEWNVFSALQISKPFDLKIDDHLLMGQTLERLSVNPLPWINEFITISSMQPSPQSEAQGMYLTNITEHDDDDTIYDVDF